MAFSRPTYPTCIRSSVGSGLRLYRWTQERTRLRCRLTSSSQAAARRWLVRGREWTMLRSWRSSSPPRSLSIRPATAGGAGGLSARASTDTFSIESVSMRKDSHASAALASPDHKLVTARARGGRWSRRGRAAADGHGAAARRPLARGRDPGHGAGRKLPEALGERVAAVRAHRLQHVVE